MGQIRTISAHFDRSRRFFENSLGREFDFTSSTGPYEYLLGALAGCFYSTLSSFETDCTWESVDIGVEGIKRTKAPTTLEKTVLTISVHDASDEEAFRKLAERAADECSIYNTLKCVSSMEWRVRFAE